MTFTERVRYNQNSAGLTLYNAYLSSAGITLRQLHIQIIRKKGIWPERHLNRNMALICCPNIVRASHMAPEIHVWPTDSNSKSFQSGEPKELSIKQVPADKSAPLVASVHGRNVWFGCLIQGSGAMRICHLASSCSEGYSSSLNFLAELPVLYGTDESVLVGYCLASQITEMSGLRSCIPLSLSTAWSSSASSTCKLQHINIYL